VAQQQQVELDQANASTDAAQATVSAFEAYRGAEFDEARKLFRLGCRGDDAGGCTMLGLMMIEGEGGPRNLAAARALLAHGCKGEEPLACAYLGVLYETGISGSRDDERAKDLYRSACDAGDEFGCQNAARLQ